MSYLSIGIRQGIFGAIIMFLAIPPGASAAELPTFSGELWRWNAAAPALIRSLPSDSRGVEDIATGDLGADGVEELIVGSGIGAPATVRTLRADGSQIFSFAAFAEDVRSGVRVVVGDLDNDGTRDIVAATGAGPSSRVRVFSRAGVPDGEGFLPYGDRFRGGLAFAVGDFSGKGTMEIATIPSSGGGPHVKIMKKSGRVIGEFSAFSEAPAGDHDLAAGDVDGNGQDELIAMRIEAGRPIVRVLSASTGKALQEFPVGMADENASLSAGDVDGDGQDEIFVVSGPRPHLYVYDGTGKLLVEREVLGSGQHGTARVAVGAFGAGERALIIMHVASGADARPSSPKFIEVDVSEQRLRAYEYGKLVRSTLVATGLPATPTPIGDFNITDKPYTVHYAWFYGPGSPQNYDLGLVNWNLRFQPHIYLHYAPWRSKFGVRGSHGCVNLSKADAMWIYGWADVGTPVTVKE